MNSRQISGDSGGFLDINRTRVQSQNENVTVEEYAGGYPVEF